MSTSSYSQLDLYREILRDQLVRVQKGRFKLHVPRSLAKMRDIAGTHFHFNPELFIQVSGLTDFCFPKERIRLLAGEVLLVPRALPHHEIARDFKGRFFNLVVIFPRNGVSLHAAIRDDRGLPRRFGQGKSFKTERGQQLMRYLDDIADYTRSQRSWKKSREAALVIQGLFQAVLAGLLLAVKREKTIQRVAEHPKINECRQYILRNIGDVSLSVKRVAGHIRCSPDYLSHLFALETGENLSGFIHRERVALAKRHLQNTAASIKEIASACGFTDQAHFARLFKRFTGETPKAFRKIFSITVVPRIFHKKS
jgi:AraC-like DNA-binding protein